MTTEQEVTRKLRAILSADVKGYSRLMSDDESNTIRTLKEYRNIMTGVIEKHSGRVVDAPGDNMLAEFSSIVNAVQSAVEIQKILKQANADIPIEKKFEFRIGVNIGDVIQDGESLYGEGVNIAARIEGLADPGGVCISRGAYDHIRNKLKLGYEYIGEHSVKNINYPVRVYKLLMETTDAGKLIGDEPKPILKPGTWATVITAAIVFILIGYQVFQKLTTPEFEPASIEEMAFPLPDRPSIAVLPFDNMSNDPNQEFFSDGITENIISSLSKTEKLFVIARNSTFVYKGKPVRVRQVAEELGVQYVLEGSVQKSEDRVRITAQLIDAIEGHHLWAGKYDRDLKDLFVLQDEITMKIATALQIKLTEGEQYRTMAKQFQSLDVMLKAMEIRSLFAKGGKENNIKVADVAQEIIDMAPESATGYKLLSWHYWFLATTGQSPKESIEKAFKLAKKTLSMDESDSTTHALLGSVYLAMRKYEKAIAAGEQSVELDPNSAMAHGLLGITLGYAGRLDEAIAYLKKGIRLNPFPEYWNFYHLGRCYRMKGQYEEALSATKKAVHLAPNSRFCNYSLAAIYALLNRQDEASAAVKKVLELDPNFSVERASKAWLFKNKSDLKLFVDALVKAGLPYRPAMQLPDKPSIAILPFKNMSNDPEQEYFSDGITEDIISNLSKTSKLFVIARNSTFTYKNKSVKVQEIGKELGVQFVLEGSVRKVGSKVRITAQLIDANTGYHLWADNYDRDLIDIFAIQDDITKQIIEALHVKLTIGEDARLIAEGTKNLKAYLKYLQARELHYRFNKKDNQNSRRLVEVAISMDPQYGMAYALLGATHMLDVWLQATKSRKDSLDRAIKYQQEAITLGANAHHVLGFIYSMIEKHDQANIECKKAVELAPNSATARTFYGLVLNKSGYFKEAVHELELSLRLDPLTSSFTLRALATVYCNVGQPEKAIVLCEKAIKKEPNDLIAHLIFTQACNLADQQGKAKKIAEKVLRIKPNFSLNSYAKSLGYKNQMNTDRIIASLSAAGLPE